MSDSILTPISTAETIASDRDSFNSYVYTAWNDAAEELQRRDTNPALQHYIDTLLPRGLPECMQGKKSMVLFRHVATSNYEVNRFLICADALNELHPLLLEYTQDRFTNRNEWKYSLGRIFFYKGTSRAGEPIFEGKNIIDFNSSNTKPISSLQTLSGRSLVDVHHELFLKRFPYFKDNIYDVSEWLSHIGHSAKEYYKSFFSLFLKDAVLFENFLLEGKEHQFTQEVILPALMEIQAETGLKPLIVALEPTDIEGDHFWLSHPFSEKETLEQLLG